jgi:hypothetical protein
MKSPRNHRSGLIHGLAPIMLVLLLPAFCRAPLHAATYWQTGTANWTDSGVWNNGQPTLDDDAYINNGGTARITAGITGYANDLFLGRNSGQSGNVLITGGALYVQYDQYIGYEGTGTFTQQGGENRCSYGKTQYDLYLGYSAGGSGTYTMSGGTLYTGDQYIGRLGSGTFIQSGGVNHLSATATSAADHMYIGYATGGGAGSGTYRLTGTAELSVDDDDTKIYVGYDGLNYYGTGRFEWFRSGGITWSEGRDQGGMVIGSNGTLAIGYDCSSIADFVSGLQNGTLEITNGATITKNNDGVVSQVKYLRFGSATGAGYGVQNGGTVQVGQSATVGDNGTGTATQNGGSFNVTTHLYMGINSPSASGTYRLNGGTLSVGGSIYGGTGTGTLIIDGGSLSIGGNYLNVTNLTLGDQAGRSGSFTLAGKTANIGTMIIGNAGTGTFSQSGGTCNAGSLTIGAGGSYTMTGGALAVSGAAIVGQGGSATLNIGGQNPTVGSLTMRNGSILGSGTITAGATYAAENGSIEARLAGAVGLLKSTSGTITLGGANTYSGANTLRNGTLIAATNAPSGAAGAFGNAASTINVGDAGTASGDNLALMIGGAYTVGRNITVNNYGNSVTLGGSNTSGTATFGGNVSLARNAYFSAASGGTVQFSGTLSGSGQTATLSGAGNVKVAPAAAGTNNLNYIIGGGGGGRLLGGANSSGTLQYTGNITLYNALTLAAADGGTVEFLSGTWTSNNNALTVGAGGTGTVKISNTLNTSAAVNVSSGTLLVNGSLGGGGNSLTTALGTTLGGNGSISKQVVVNGTLAPGASTGVLTVDGSLALAGESLFELQAYRSGGPGAGYYDGLLISGSGHTFAFGGTLNVVNLNGGPAYAAGQVYDLFDWGDNAVLGSFSYVNLPSLSGGLQWKMFGDQPFDYATGQIVVEQGTQVTHYGLEARLAVEPNVLLNGYVAATSSITCTGSGQMDTLDFTGLGAITTPGGSISGPTINGADVQHGQTVVNNGLTFKGMQYNDRVRVNPLVASATNHTIGGPATLDWNNGAIVNVGLAKAGEGLERQLFGPALVGMGESKKLPGQGIIHDYAGLASKTLPGSWLGGGETLGTEAIIREGIDTSAAGHTVSMEWRQRYDGLVGGVPGSEILETKFLQSDVLKLTGMDIAGGVGDERRRADVFVLQMSYVDGNDYPGKPHWLLYLDLGADGAVGGVDEAADRWLDAPAGNFAGKMQPLVEMSWDDFRLANPGSLDELLGCWGWFGDGQGTGVAWAVLDYNHAQFAVPEPSTLALLLGMTILLAWRGLRRKRG